MEKKYFKLQLKTALKLYPTILLITVFIITAVAGACAMLISKSSSSDDKQKIALAVVGDLENTYISVGLEALEHFDSSRFYIDITEMKQDEANEALKKREISGYLYIPDSFVSDINSGKNTHAQYFTLNNPTGFGTIVSNEIVLVASEIITETQNGIFAMQDVAHQSNAKNVNGKTDELIVAYLTALIDRTALYHNTTLGISDSLTFAEYYVCSIIILFMLFWGISCNRLFSSRHVLFSKQLKLGGLKARTQVMCEFLPYLIITFITLCAVFLILALTIPFTGLDISLFDGMNSIFTVIKIIPVIVMITMMQFAVYEIFSHTLSAVLLQFMLTIILGYFSGLFYPNYFFPEIIQKLSVFLPVGRTQSAARSFEITGEFSSPSFLMYTVQSQDALSS